MEEIQNKAVDHNSDAKRNRLLIICAVISPFVIIFLDTALLNYKSFFEENVAKRISKENFPVYGIFFLYFLYLMVPSIFLIGFFKTERRRLIYSYLFIVFILYPVSLVVYIVTIMLIYNAYP